MVLQGRPVVLHQIERILVSQRKEIEVLLLAQLVALVEDVVAHLQVTVEVSADNVGIAPAKTAYYLLVLQQSFTHIELFGC